MWDLAILGLVPGMRVAAPRDAARLRQLLAEAVDDESGPTAVRFPKASVDGDINAIDRLGAMDVLRRAEDSDVLIVAVGPQAALALDVADRLAAQGVGATVVDPRWVLPVDAALPALVAAHSQVVVIEDGVIAGGVGAAISRELRARGIAVPLRQFALPQEFIAHGERGPVLAACGLSAQEIARVVIESVASASSLSSG
jgi:1-deoxy-D-xylulose-5-phosphate synthase